MAYPYLEFTDATGTARITSSVPRLGNWIPILADVGARSAALGTQRMNESIWFRGMGASFEMPGLRAWDFGIILRLKRHLFGGGALTLSTGDKSSRTYTVGLYPGTEPSWSIDRRSLKYTLILSVLNRDAAAGGAPMIAIYEGVAPPTALAVTTATPPVLTWTDNSADETSFRIERAAGLNATTGFTEIASVAANVVTYTDTTASANTAYTWRVRARTPGGDSQYSNIASTTTPAGGPTVSDTFTRADSTTSMGNAETGQAWVVDTAVYGIISNRAYNTTSGTYTPAHVNSGLSDCTVQVTHVTTFDGGVVVRYTDVNNYFWLRTFGPYKFYRKQAGVLTELWSGGTIAAGDVQAIVLSGSSITIKINGVTQTTLTDAFNQTATRHGILDVSTGRFDNFTVAA